MNQTWSSLLAAGLMLSVGGPFSRIAAQTGQVSARANADSTVPSVNPADAHFMSGMIIHHEQAVLMAGWAPSHRAGPTVATLCKRIVISQQDEIALMERWLRDHGQALPDTAWVFDYTGPAMAHATLMAGMLTVTQLAQLDSARGPEFDRLFLTFMIQHHRGALTMVERLFNTPGAAQDNFVFQFASEINAGQTVEIHRMSRMLAALPAPAQH